MHVTILSRAHSVSTPAPLPLAVPEAGDELRLFWQSEADCQACAQLLAAQLEPRLKRGASVLIELHGTLGAGKTTFTRHLLRALGVQGRIKSPSYAVVEPHELPGLPMWHFDFYRFADPREWEDAGFRDVFGSPGLKLVEWPDKAAGLLPPYDLRLDLSTHDHEERSAHWRADTPTGHELIQAMTPQPTEAP
jgi:tRNA threonylcarbamoyladenosine biosynthesis protein TsaE